MVSEKTVKNQIKKFADARDEYYKCSKKLEEVLDQFTDNEAYSVVCFDEYCELRFKDMPVEVITKTINLPTQWQGDILKVAIPSEGR